MHPLETLFETADLASQDMPQRLRHLYGGDLGFQTRRVYGNFVSSLDGVVAIDGVDHSSQMISGKSEADRFVMGLLRAFADAVVIGAGTLRAAPDSLWTPAYIFRDAAAEFAQLRRVLRRDGEPRLVVLTASGRLDPHHRALEAGALVVTTSAGAAALRSRLPGSSKLLALGPDSDVDLADVMSVLRSEGHDALLTEGGPTVIGGILQTGLLDELFVTVSPVLAGRSRGSERPGLVDGLDLLPSRMISGDLWSLRRHGSHLFLRYGIEADDPVAAATRRRHGR
jgi:riboflavin biosynthesis pyrimidine reductase